MAEPFFFEDQAALRVWFEQHYQIEKELLVGYYTVKSGRRSVTWSESVDEAICFGWIDGIRRSINEESYCIRFTPRRPGSNWSNVNITKAKKLTELGLMYPSGIQAYEKRKISRSGVYSYETDPLMALNDNMVKLFQENKGAWNYFCNETPSYRKVTIRWIMSAVQDATRLSRLYELISSSANGEKIKAMRWNSKKS